MTNPNDVVWTKIEVPVRATPETPETPVVTEGEAPQTPDLAIKPETAPVTPETPVEVDVEDDMAARLELALTRLRRTWLPPDIVHQNRPSLLRVIAYAWAGDWGPKTGILRTLGKVDAVLFAVPLVTLFYSLAWWVERPARRMGGIALLSSIAWLVAALGWWSL